MNLTNEKKYYILLSFFGLLVSFYYFPVTDQAILDSALITSGEVKYKDQLTYAYIDSSNNWSLIYNLIRLMINLNLSVNFINFFILLIPLYMNLFGVFLISKRLSNNLIFSLIISCFIIVGKIHFGNLDYPVLLITHHTAGMFAQACGLLMFGLIAERKINLTIILSILTLGFHLVVGVWLLSILLLAILLFKREDLNMKFLSKVDIILITSSVLLIVLSLIEFQLTKVETSWPNDEYLYQVFLDVWDNHRSKIYGINYVYISLSSLMLLLMFFFQKQNKKKEEDSFFLKTVTLQVLLAFIIYISYKLLPNLYQGIFLKVIPGRFFLIHSVFGVAIILAIIFFYLKPLFNNKKILIIFIVIVLIHPFIYFDKYKNKFGRIFKNLPSINRNYEQNFWEKIKKIDLSDGVILTSIHSCSKALQKAKKPILICSEAMDGGAYRPTLLVPLKIIIEEIYDMNFFNPPIRNMGGLGSDEIYKKTFEDRSLGEWLKISKNFNLNGLILPVEWNLKLKKSLIGKKFTYYDLQKINNN
tara:strand:- start:3693 stop:5282 length:1590 start_codon:yes stop_codon:yes gene_type:complete